jgi:hypothetical protein
LEKLTGMRVINGGVCGYGIDQSFMRAEKLVAEYKPDILIFGFTPDDIRRCGLSVYIRVPKPYFSIDNNLLQLHNQHIKEDAISANDGVIRRFFGYSFFIHKVMRRVIPQYWVQGAWRSIGSGESGEKISGLLMHNLTNFYTEFPSIKKIYILVQYLANPSADDYTNVNNVLMMVNGGKIEIIDMRYKLNEIKKSDFEMFRSLYYKHMTAAGNSVIANTVADIINRRDKDNE